MHLIWLLRRPRQGVTTADVQTRLQEVEYELVQFSVCTARKTMVSSGSPPHAGLRHARSRSQPISEIVAANIWTASFPQAST